MSRVAPRCIEYAHTRWNPEWCKRCNICVQCCPKQALLLKDDAIIEVEGCNRCSLCERLCPDLAIEVMEPRSKGRRP